MASQTGLRAQASSISGPGLPIGHRSLVRIYNQAPGGAYPEGVHVPEGKYMLSLSHGHRWFDIRAVQGLMENWGPIPY